MKDKIIRALKTIFTFLICLVVYEGLVWMCLNCIYVGETFREWYVYLCYAIGIGTAIYSTREFNRYIF